MHERIGNVQKTLSKLRELNTECQFVMLAEEAKEVIRPDHEGPSTFYWGKCHPDRFLCSTVNPT